MSGVHDMIDRSRVLALVEDYEAALSVAERRLTLDRERYIELARIWEQYPDKFSAARCAAELRHLAEGKQWEWALRLPDGTAFYQGRTRDGVSGPRIFRMEGAAPGFDVIRRPARWGHSSFTVGAAIATDESWEVAP